MRLRLLHVTRQTFQASYQFSCLFYLQVGARSLYQLIQPLTLPTSHLLVDPVSAQHQGRQPILYMGSDVESDPIK
jgi:hypothetical protein